MPRVITNNGYDIGYEEAGSGDHIPIVFLHGVGSDKSVWRPQLDYFGKTRRAVAFDYPGYGDSDPAPKGTTRDDYASAIISGMHELGIDRAHVCGLSLGGIIAIALHHADPKCCASLILRTHSRCTPTARRSTNAALRAAMICGAWPKHGSTCCSASPPIRRCAARSSRRWHALIPPLTASASKQYGSPTSATGPPRYAFRRSSCAEPRTRLRRPHSQELAGLIPGAELRLIAGSGHISNLEKADEFNLLVEEFIKQAD